MPTVETNESESFTTWTSGLAALRPVQLQRCRSKSTASRCMHIRADTVFVPPLWQCKKFRGKRARRDSFLRPRGGEEEEQVMDNRRRAKTESARDDNQGKKNNKKAAGMSRGTDRSRGWEDDWRGDEEENDDEHSVRSRHKRGKSACAGTARNTNGN